MKHGRLRATLLAGACVFTHRWALCGRAATLSIPYLLNSITQSKAKVGWYSLGSLTSAMICMLLGGALADSKGARPPDTHTPALPPGCIGG